MEAMVAQVLCQFDQPFVGQLSGLASRQYSLDQALLSANHLPVNNHLLARNFDARNSLSFWLSGAVFNGP